MENQIGGVNRSTNRGISSPNHPLGSSAILNFGGRISTSRNTSSYPFDHEENCEDSLDEIFNQPEKKRRLSMNQVQFLEKCFVFDNKLEPDRKIKIAKELGLQPRQITIWFQNRRARWKTRQLETDFEKLNKNYETLRTEYENLVNEHEKLKFEILRRGNDSLRKPVDDIFDEEGLMCAGCSFIEPEYPNLIPNREDEFMMPNGNGFYSLP